MSQIDETNLPSLAEADWSLVDENKPLAIGISGGSDSVGLAIHAALLRKNRQDSPPVLLTVDHGLRRRARREALWCAALANRLGLVHHTIETGGLHGSGNLQARARTARLSLLLKWCQDHNCDQLLLAHTANDQAETVLMRLERGSGVDGLAGIWAERKYQGVRLLRPLLRVSRWEIQDDLLKRGQSWLTDPTNFDPKYLRVRIRNNVAAFDLEAAASTETHYLRSAGKGVKYQHAGGEDHASQSGQSALGTIIGLEKSVQGSGGETPHVSGGISSRCEPDSPQAQALVQRLVRTAEQMQQAVRALQIQEAHHARLSLTIEHDRIRLRRENWVDIPVEIRLRMLASCLKAVGRRIYRPRYSRLLRVEGLIIDCRNEFAVTLHGCQLRSHTLDDRQEVLIIPEIDDRQRRSAKGEMYNDQGMPSAVTPSSSHSRINTTEIAADEIPLSVLPDKQSQFDNFNRLTSTAVAELAARYGIALTSYEQKPDKG